MKIIFYDGDVNSFLQENSYKPWFYKDENGLCSRIKNFSVKCISAGDGYKSCIKKISRIKDSHEFILTNLVDLMDSRYTWNEEQNKFDLWFIEKKSKSVNLINVQNFYSQKLCKVHIVSQLYKKRLLNI